MKRNFVLGIVAGLAVAGLSLAGCDDGGTVTPDAVGEDTITGVDTPTGTDTEQPDTVTTGDTVVPTDEGKPDEGPVGKPNLNYRITSLQITTPGDAENTGFASLMNTVLPIALGGDTFGSQLYILATFSDVSAGASGVVVTFCQGEENADGSLSCVADPAPVVTTGSINASGMITTDAADFTFAVSTPAGAIALTLANFTMSGLLDATADNGPVSAPDDSTGLLEDGTFSAQLPADDLCGITISNAVLAGFCDGITTVNLLDLLDGPAEECGQDASANLETCIPSTDGTTHNLAVDVDGELRFDAEGTFDLIGIVYQ